MIWHKRNNHGASHCDVCLRPLPRAAIGRPTWERDYQEGGALYSEAGRRLGLLLVCSEGCAVVADVDDAYAATEIR